MGEWQQLIYYFHIPGGAVIPYFLVSLGSYSVPTMSLSYAGGIKLCIILAVVLCGSSHMATNLPGFRTALTTKGLDYSEL